MIKNHILQIYTAMHLLITLLLTGCFGGGNNSNTPSLNDSYTAGVFQSADSLQDYCAVPRTGIDPYTSAPYPDQSGSAMFEKLYLRSFSHETYLWYDEIPDIDPTPFSVANYFTELKTDAVTESGKAKDQFHFTQDSASYNQQTVSGTTYGYGFQWKTVSSTGPNREWYIAYVEDNSPASQAGIERGDKLMQVDSALFQNGNSDILNAGLFPEEIGEAHNFVFQRKDGTSVALELISAEVALTLVDDVEIFTAANNRKVGYFRFNSFKKPGQDPLIDAFQQLADANVSELIVDLRYNGGGLLAMSSQLAYMVAGAGQTQQQIFNQNLYNDKTAPSDAMGFFDFKIDWDNGVGTNIQLPSVNLPRVYVLATNGTCSASEAFINGLRGINIDARLIGETTCGKPYGFLPQENCGTTYFTVQFKGANAKDFGDYSDGFIPSQSANLSTEILGCSLADDVMQPLGTPQDPMISAALGHIATGDCPPVVAQRRTLRPRVSESDDPVFKAYQRSLMQYRIDRKITLPSNH